MPKGKPSTITMYNADMTAFGNAIAAIPNTAAAIAIRSKIFRTINAFFDIA